MPMSTSAQAASAGKTSRSTDGITVMVVDDSLVFRGLASRWLSEVPDVSEVIKHGNAQDALKDLDTHRPDVIILDVHMPGSDGFAILPIILSRLPGVPVLLVTASTYENAELTAKAKASGAWKFLIKPSSTGGANNARAFRDNMVQAVLAASSGERSPEQTASRPNMPQRGASAGAGRAAQSTAAAPAARAVPQPVRRAPPAAGRRPATAQPAAAPAAASEGGLETREFSKVVPRILAVGSSTGGPRALMDFIGDITKSCSNVPIVIVQHMPDAFTGLLADHLARKSGRECRRPDQGEVARPGVIYVAPGGRHLLLAEKDRYPVFHFDDGPPINFCKPAVDPMFESVATLYKAATLSVILTGMGQDGLVGARAVTTAGGSVIAQDEASSVVWGMPGVVARAGLASAILPLGEIGPRVSRLLGGER